MIASGSYAPMNSNDEPAPRVPIYGCNVLGQKVELASYVVGLDPNEPIHKELTRLVNEGKQDTEEYWQLVEQLEVDL